MSSEIFIYSTTGVKEDTLKLELASREKEGSAATYVQAIRVLRQNWRQGTVGTKTRAEVSFSGRKPWRQKGTGRARAGTLASPLWRKGGVIFGPQPRTRKLTINDKQKRLSFNLLLFSLLKEGRISCLDFDFGGNDKPRTKQAFEALKAVKNRKKNSVLFLSQNDSINFASFRNIAGLNIISFQQPNAFDLSCVGHWIFLKKDWALFKDMVSKWT